MSDKQDHDLLIQIHTHTSTMLEQLKTLNGRVRKLEIWRGYLTGAVVLLGFILGIVAKIF